MLSAKNKNKLYKAAASNPPAGGKKNGSSNKSGDNKNVNDKNMIMDKKLGTSVVSSFCIHPIHPGSSKFFGGCSDRGLLKKTLSVGDGGEVLILPAEKMDHKLLFVDQQDQQQQHKNNINNKTLLMNGFLDEEGDLSSSFGGDHLVQEDSESRRRSRSRRGVGVLLHDQDVEDHGQHGEGSTSSSFDSSSFSGDSSSQHSSSQDLALTGKRSDVVKMVKKLEKEVRNLEDERKSLHAQVERLKFEKENIAQLLHGDQLENLEKESLYVQNQKYSDEIEQLKKQNDALSKSFASYIKTMQTFIASSMSTRGVLKHYGISRKYAESDASRSTTSASSSNKSSSNKSSNSGDGASNPSEAATSSSGGSSPQQPPGLELSKSRNNGGADPTMLAASTSSTGGGRRGKNGGMKRPQVPPPPLLDHHISAPAAIGGETKNKNKTSSSTSESREVSTGTSRSKDESITTASSSTPRVQSYAPPPPSVAPPEPPKEFSAANMHHSFSTPSTPQTRRTSVTSHHSNNINMLAPPPSSTSTSTKHHQHHQPAGLVQNSRFAALATDGPPVNHYQPTPGPSSAPSPVSSNRLQLPIGSYTSGSLAASPVHGSSSSRAGGSSRVGSPYEINDIMTPTSTTATPVSGPPPGLAGEATPPRRSFSMMSGSRCSSPTAHGWPAFGTSSGSRVPVIVAPNTAWGPASSRTGSTSGGGPGSSLQPTFSSGWGPAPAAGTTTSTVVGAVGSAPGTTSSVGGPSSAPAAAGPPMMSSGVNMHQQPAQHGNLSRRTSNATSSVMVTTSTGVVNNTNNGTSSPNCSVEQHQEQLTASEMQSLREQLLQVCRKFEVEKRTTDWFLQAEHAPFWRPLIIKSEELGRRNDDGSKRVKNPSAWLTKYFNILRTDPDEPRPRGPSSLHQLPSSYNGAGSYNHVVPGSSYSGQGQQLVSNISITSNSVGGAPGVGSAPAFGRF